MICQFNTHSVEAESIQTGNATLQIDSIVLYLQQFLSGLGVDIHTQADFRSPAPK